MFHLLATITAGLVQLRWFPAGPHKSLLQHPFLWYRGEVQVPFTLVGEYFRGPSTLVHGSVTGTLACIMVHVSITGTLYHDDTGECYREPVLPALPLYSSMHPPFQPSFVNQLRQ